MQRTHLKLSNLRAHQQVQYSKNVCILQEDRKRILEAYHRKAVFQRGKTSRMIRRIDEYYFYLNVEICEEDNQRNHI